MSVILFWIGVVFSGILGVSVIVIPFRGKAEREIRPYAPFIPLIFFVGAVPARYLGM